jgi:hypothetical protein
VRRREFILALGGAAAAWPIAGSAQQAAMPVIGFLRSASLTDATQLIDAFRQGLKDIGYAEGQNVAIEYRSADNNRNLATDFARRPVAVIVGNVLAALAAKAVTTTVPIVFATGSDPVRDGLVTSLNRPGGNVTGVSFFAARLGAKRLELLRQLVPAATTIAVLVAPGSDAVSERRDLESAAHNPHPTTRIYCHARQCDSRVAARGARAAAGDAGDWISPPGQPEPLPLRNAFRQGCERGWPHRERRRQQLTTGLVQRGTREDANE